MKEGSCEVEAVYGSYFSSLFLAPMSMHVPEGAISRLKADSLKYLLFPQVSATILKIQKLLW